MPGMPSTISQPTRSAPRAGPQPLEEAARQATRLLGRLGDRRRLLLLCPLAEGAAGDGELAVALGVPETAIPQMFGPLCSEGLVVAEQEGRSRRYRLAAPETARVLRLLRDLYCPPAA